MGAHGTYETIDGRPALRFERRLAHRMDTVWYALSAPVTYSHWFPQTVDFEAMNVGTDVVFSFPGDDAPADTGRIVDVHAPHLLAFTWFGDILTFEVEEVDEGAASLLRFTHLIGDPETAARTMAGWHLCLDRLADHLDGLPAAAPGPEATEEWRGLYDEYVAHGVPHGAPIPQ